LESANEGSILSLPVFSKEIASMKKEAAHTKQNPSRAAKAKSSFTERKNKAKIFGL
jgi:hypothetical protein